MQTLSTDGLRKAGRFQWNGFEALLRENRRVHAFVAVSRYTSLLCGAFPYCIDYVENHSTAFSSCDFESFFNKNNFVYGPVFRHGIKSNVDFKNNILMQN